MTDFVTWKRKEENQEKTRSHPASLSSSPQEQKKLVGEKDISYKSSETSQETNLALKNLQ